MCVVSMVMDYGHKIPEPWWTPSNAEKFMKLVKFAEQFDEETGQPDCIDPEKAELLERVEKLLEKLEDKVDKLDVSSKS